MAQEFYKAIVPGSTMLLGEHAVLFNGQAIVCAINKYLQVTLQVLAHSNSPICTIVSPSLGTIEIKIDDFLVTQPFTFVLQAIKLFSAELQKLSCNIKLSIESDFLSTIGFGSSSAVTVAIIAVIYKFINNSEIALEDLFIKSWQVIKMVQKVGSGADVAASIYGGVIAYNAKSYQVTQLPTIPNFYLIYSGYKTATPVVIEHVARLFKNEPAKLRQIYDAIEQTVLAGIKCIENTDYTKLHQIFDQAYSLQKQLQVSDECLDQIVELAGSGTKISGSGLGDCIITFNQPTIEKYQVYPIQVSTLGLQYV